MSDLMHPGVELFSHGSGSSEPMRFALFLPRDFDPVSAYAAYSLRNESPFGGVSHLTGNVVGAFEQLQDEPVHVVSKYGSEELLPMESVLSLDPDDEADRLIRQGLDSAVDVLSQKGTRWEVREAVSVVSPEVSDALSTLAVAGEGVEKATLRQIDEYRRQKRFWPMQRFSRQPDLRTFQIESLHEWDDVVRYSVPIRLNDLRPDIAKLRTFYANPEQELPSQCLELMACLAHIALRSDIFAIESGGLRGRG